MAVTIRVFQRVLENLRKIPRTLFLFVYALAIVVFAWLYHNQPLNAFLDSTAKFEPKVIAQAFAVAQDIRTCFLEQHPELAQILLFQPSNILPPLFSVQPQAEGVKVSYKPILRPPMVETPNLVELTFRNGAVFHPWTAEPGNFKSDTLIEVEVNAEQVSGNKRDLSKLFPCALATPNTSTCLRMYEHDFMTLSSLSSTEQGFPGREQRSFTRMLYLSLVTISTLGHGDIVPITNEARFLVTGEAWLGPILLALFINSLISSPTPRS